MLYLPRVPLSLSVPLVCTYLQASENAGWTQRFQPMVLDSSDGVLNKIGELSTDTGPPLGTRPKASNTPSLLEAFSCVNIILPLNFGLNFDPPFNFPLKN